MNKRLLSGCTLTELAQAYLPNDTPDVARRILRKWIAMQPRLEMALMHCGLTLESVRGPKRRLTPQQVRLIFEALGEP